MPVSSIAASFGAYAQSFVSSSSTSPKGSVQEADETPAQTAKEAQHGDRVAKAKLAKAAAAKQSLRPSVSITEAGKGGAVDHVA